MVPIMSVYQLPLVQYGYCGHVINLPQDVASFFAAFFPCMASQLGDVVACKEGAGRSHKDFR